MSAREGSKPYCSARCRASAGKAVAAWIRCKERVGGAMLVWNGVCARRLRWKARLLMVRVLKGVHPRGRCVVGCVACNMGGMVWHNVLCLVVYTHTHK